MTNHNVGDLILYIRTNMDGDKTYELGIIKSIMPASTPYKKRYFIDWMDGEQRMQKSYSDHDIQYYKEGLELYMKKEK